MRRKNIGLFYFLLFAFVSFQVFGERTFFEGKTELEDPFSLRDPFKRPFFDLGNSEKKEKPLLLRPKEESDEELVGKMNVADLKIVGILIGKERRAMLQGDRPGKTILLKEGMLIGPNQAEVKAILPAGIVIVEKMKNIYEETEYLETIIPITPNKK